MAKGAKTSPRGSKRPKKGIGEQPLPRKNGCPAVWDLVVADMVARDELGAKRYGTRLQPFNGRDALRDAYEESLDLCVYLRQVIYERDSPQPTAHDLVPEFEKWTQK